MTLTAIAELDTEHPGRIVVNCPFRLKDSVKAVPGARWDVEAKVWTVPQTWPSCVALRAEFGDQLTLGRELRLWARPVGADKKYLRAIRPEVDGFEVPEEFHADTSMTTLYPHQVIDAVGIAQAEKYLIMNGTGTGKTRSALAGIRLIQAKGGEPFPVLIAAPLSMLRTWETEIAAFFPKAVVSVVTGTPSKVRKALEPGAEFYIICWDSLRRYSRLVPFGSTKMTDGEKEEHELNFIDFQTFIGDECHRCKNPKAKRTRAAWYVAHHCRYRIGLTGTPVQDTPKDLYGLLHLVAPDEYPTQTSFLDRYIQYSWNPWGGMDILGIREDREAEWLDNFDTRSRRITKEMVLDFLPPKVESVRWVEMSTKHRKAYDTLENTYAVQLEESVMTVENQLVLAGRLLQLSNAMGDIESYEATNKAGEAVTKQRFVMSGETSPKVDSFISDYLEGDYEGESIVVFSDSYQLLKLAKEALTAKEIEFVEISGKVTGDDRAFAMKRFQAGEVPVCLLTRAGGEGITLTAASTMVRLVRSWSLTVHQQVEDRVHRIGSEIHESIRYVDYLMEDTVEEGQFARLAEKEGRASETLRDGELLGLLKARRAV